MALTLSQDDLDAIEALNPHNYEGGFDPEDEPVESVEDQTRTHTLKDGTLRVDQAFIPEPEE